MSSVKDSLPQPASQQICVHGLGPHLGVLATWDLRRMPSTQTRHRHRHSLSHRWPSALCLVSWHHRFQIFSEPAHEYVVRTRASRLRTLRRIAGLSLPGAAGHPQPYHAQLPSLPGSLTVVWRCMDSSDPAVSTSTACRSAACRRQAWTLAACRRFEKAWSRDSHLAVASSGSCEGTE